MFGATALRSSIHAGAGEIPPRIGSEEARSGTLSGPCEKHRTDQALPNPRGNSKGYEKAASSPRPSPPEEERAMTHTAVIGSRIAGMESGATNTVRAPSPPLEERAGERRPRFRKAAQKWRDVPVFLVCLSVLTVCAAILYFLDPAHFDFYPKCAFYQSTGLLCPGCGSLRALHQLLHGHWAEALRFNALLVLFLP